jgi:hypothetical protein
MPTGDDTHDNDNDDNDDELERLERECVAMVALIRQLEREELEYLQQAKILAREALLCGYQPHLLETPAPKRRRLIMKPKEE